MGKGDAWEMWRCYWSEMLLLCGRMREKGERDRERVACLATVYYMPPPKKPTVLSRYGRVLLPVWSRECRGVRQEYRVKRGRGGMLEGIRTVRDARDRVHVRGVVGMMQSAMSKEPVCAEGGDAMLKLMS